MNYFKRHNLQIIISFPFILSLSFFSLSCGNDDHIDEAYIFPIEDNSKSDSTYTGDNTPKESIVFSELKIGKFTDVVYSARNFLIERMEKDEKKYLRISNNLGETWKELENPYGNPVFFHIFSTGDILFATREWCYYIDNELTNIYPSQVYDYNGKIFEATTPEPFYQCGDCKNHIWKVLGTEIIVWGDYSIKNHYKPRVWYSKDFGRTIKCAISFNETKIDGTVQYCRHVHGVKFDKFDKFFYITTGDSKSQCQLIKGKYDPTNDKWEFHRLGSGDEYKFVATYFDEEYAYLVTDYTTKECQSGLIKCKKDSLDDSSHFKYLYSDVEKKAFLCCEFDMNGNHVLMPDGSVKTFIYYARDNYDFRKIPLSQTGYIQGFTSPNYAGDVYAGYYNGTPYKYFNFTKAMRDSGVKDYMEIKNPMTMYYDEDFFFSY